MSTSRLEKFIYAICSMEVSDLPAPLSRIEILWNCLITGETPDFEPQSRNEQYLMAMLGLYELENLPTPMSRGEKLLYKIAMGETDLSDIPAYLSRYEELLGYLAENGGVGDFEYILQTLNQRLSTLYSTKERPMKQSVIKGDTLVNELPRPSLKNTMSNTASQKLNQGYDNGKTLVNIKGEKTELVSDTLSDTRRCDFLIPLVKTNTVYLIKYNITVTGGTLALGFLNDTNTWSNNLENAPTNGIIKLNSGNNPNYFRCIVNRDQVITVNNLMIIEYQNGMENWDIPYFEGTKTFSATPNVIDGEFKQAVVKGQTDYKSINWMTNFHYQYGLKISNGKVEYIPRNNRCSTRIEIDENRSFIFKAPSDIYISIVTADINNNNLRDYGWYVTTTDEIRFTVEDNCKFLYLNFKKPNESAFISESEIINSGLIVKEQKLVSVRLSEVTTENVKNLINKQTIQYGYIDEDGKFKPNDTDMASDYIKITPNTYYTYQVSSNIGSSMRFSFFNESKNIIARTATLNASGGKYATYMSPSDAYYVRTHSNNFNNIGFNPDLISLVEGDKPLSSYEHQSNTLTLAEPVTLRKVGDVEDTFDALTGQVTERVGEVVLDKNWPWWVANNSDGTKRFGRRFNDMKPRSTILCNKLPEIVFHTAGGIYGISVYQQEIVLYTEHTTLDEFKTYLKTNPITVQYKLATESTKTVIPTITDQDGVTQSKLHSFNNGYLSVSSQGLLPSAVNYEVPTNNSYYLPDMLTLGAQYTARGSADCNATIDGKLLALGKNRTFTTPSSVTNRLMVLDAPVDDLMFIKGDQTAKDFGYFEGMKSVEINGIRVTGKNLFDGVSYIDGFIYGGGNTKVRPDNNVTSILVNLEKNTNYILSTKTSFDRSIIGGSTTPISINSYVNVIVCRKIDSRILFNSGEYTYFIIYLNNGKIELIDLQVEQGSVATPYEPYKSTTLTLNEPVTLRKVGDVQDTLDGLTGEVTERIGEIVLDGSEDWRLNGFVSDANIKDNMCYFSFKDDNLNCIINQRNGGLSDSLKNIDCASNSDKEGWQIYNNQFRLSLSKEKLSENTINGIKLYLQQNPITIQYQLATNSIKTVDLTTIDQDGQPTKLKTFNDISHVKIDADNLIPSIDVEVATKISETLATLGLEHHDISDTQNELGQTIEEQTENTDATMMATTEIYEQTL